MAARAMWKGVIGLGEEKIPVKLYSAIEDTNVHFRLLHEKDEVPVKQELINSQTEEVVPFERARRAFITDEGDMVIFEPEELDELEPEASRDIEVLGFLPPEEIDHRWYLRPYYLGPDGSEEAYFALIQAMETSGLEGLVRWTMRNKQYVGALRLHDGYPMLVTLRYDAQVVPIESLEAPAGPDLDEKELAMAGQLIGMLAADFEPEQYHDEYRQRVMEMVETKAKGGKVKTRKRRKEARYEDLSGALRASLEKERIRA
ncbi:MAG TPA: Ku protein [Trueperaceae bacterium]